MLCRTRISLVIGFMITACGTHVGAAVPSDLANYAPADTVLYVGWSRWTDQDKEGIDFARRLIRSTVEKEGGPQVLISSVIADLLLPIGAAPGAIGLRDLQFVNNELRADLFLVAAAGPDPDRYPRAMSQIIAQCGLPQRIAPLTIKGVQFQSYPVGEDQMKLTWGVYKDCFLFALSETGASAVMEAMDGAGATLASVGELKFDRGKVQAGMDGAFTCVYADGPRVWEIITRLVNATGEPEWFSSLLRQIGGTSVRSKYLHFEERDGVQRTHAFAHVVGPVQGALTLWKQPPLADESLRAVPEDAYWMYARSLDLAGTWQEFLRVAAEVSPDLAPQIEAAEATTAGILGFSLARDLLPNFGHTWILYDSPQQGGLLFTGAVLIAETKDAEALNGMLSRMVAKFQGGLAAEVAVEEKTIERKGHQIHYVMVAGAPMPLAPAWSVAGRQVVFGLYPQTVASALDQIDGAASVQADAGRGAQPATRNRSILDNAEFRAGRAGLPGPAVGIGYADSRAIARVLYPLWLGIRTALVSRATPQGSAETALAAIPTWPEERERIRSHVSTSSMDADGIMLASTGSGAGGPVFGATAVSGTLAGVLLPSLARARELSKRAVSAANLRGIGFACHTWANDHDGQFPASLDDLLENQSVTPAMLHSPLDPTGQVSYVYIAGQKNRSDPRHVLAYERVLDGEGTNVLFIDGHVQYMQLDAFRCELANTYRSLGREAEMPDEFRTTPR